MKRPLKLSRRFLSLAMVAVVAVSITFGLKVNQSTRAATILGDLNNDGIVDILDLSILLANWGKTATPTPSVSQSPANSGGAILSLNDATTGTGLNQFNFSGTWTVGTGQTGPYQGDSHYSNVSGNSYQVQFNGTQAQIYSEKNNTLGIFAVSIDGGAETMVDPYATSRQDQQLVYTSPALASGTHTIKVRITGNKNASSTGIYAVADRIDILSGGVFTSPSPSQSLTPSPSPATPTPSTSTGDVVVMASGDFNGGSEAGRTFSLMRSQNPAAILGLGDFQYDGSNVGNPATGGFNTQIGSLKSITYPTAGPTHDVNGSNTTYYTNYWGRNPYEMYSFDLGNWHIISLPSAGFRYGINVSATQSKLDADLAANTKPCTLAFWHEPYWTLPTSSHSGRDESGELAWMNSLYNKNADLILAGHQHDYQRFGPNTPSGQLDTARGIPSFVVGTGGVGFYSFSSTSGPVAPNLMYKNANTYGALKLVLKSNGYDFAFMSNAGAVLDSGSGTCH